MRPSRRALLLGAAVAVTAGCDRGSAPAGGSSTTGRASSGSGDPAATGPSSPDGVPSSAAPPSSAGPASTAAPSGAGTSPSRGITVTGDGPLARRREVERLAAVASGQVRQLWRAAPAAVRIVVPASDTEFSRITGSTSDQVPALTRPDRTVVLHPDLWSRVSARGRQVVLTHELTHVLLSPLPTTPRWVGEGAAEVTAYRPTGLRPDQVAPGVARRVRSGSPPAGPPDDAALDPGRTADLSDAYGLAWAWCAFLVARRGAGVFTGFVRTASAQPGQTGRAFRTAYGAGPAGLGGAYETWLASWA